MGLVRRVSLPAALTFVAALVPGLLFPGDTPWIFDEPAEVMIAWEANRDGHLAWHALSGNFHVQYGPLPIQLKQLMLLVSHDVRVMIVLRVVLFSSAISLGLLWLARTLKFDPWLAPVVMLSPHLWLWTRQPWAAFLVTPLSILAVAAHVAFLRHGRGRALAAAVGCAVAMPLVHPQSIPLSAVLLGHLAIRHWRGLRAHKLKVAPVLLVLAALNFQYVRGVIHTISVRETVGKGHPRGESRPAAFAGAFLGARLMTPYAFESPLLDDPEPAARVAYYVGMLPVALTGLGILAAAAAVVRRGDRYPKDLPALVLVAYLVHALFLAATRLPASPHYQFGSFGLNVLTIWIGLDALRRLRVVAPLLLSACAASLGLFTAGTLVDVHRHGWPPAFHSPTLNEQIAVVRVLDGYANEKAYTDVAPFTADPPHALLSLRRLYPPAAAPTRTAPALSIRRAPGDGRLEVIEVPSPPAGNKEIPLHYK
jgi:hypothetical protein